MKARRLCRRSSMTYSIFCIRACFSPARVALAGTLFSFSILTPVHAQTAAEGPASSRPTTAPSEAVPERDVNPPGRLIDPASEAAGSVVEIHGTVFERYREDTSRDTSARSLRGFVTYGNTSITYNPTHTLSAYVRFGFELQSPRTGGRDYNTNYYRGTTGFRGAANFDRYGFVYHNARQGLTINIGRQDEGLDASGTLYNQTYKVGLHTFLDGVALIQRLKSGTIQAYAFSEDQYQTKDTRNGLYALRGTYGLSKSTTLGVTLAHFASSADNTRAGVATTTNYEGDAVLTFGASQVTLEYAQSDAHSQNELYYAGEQYRLSPLDTIPVFTYRVGKNADIGQGTEYDNARHGTRYIYGHFFTLRVQGVLFYEAARQLSGSGKSTSTRVTLLYSF